MHLSEVLRSVRVQLYICAIGNREGDEVRSSTQVWMFDPLRRVAVDQRHVNLYEFSER